MNLISKVKEFFDENKKNYDLIVHLLRDEISVRDYDFGGISAIDADNPVLSSREWFAEENEVTVSSEELIGFEVRI